MEQLKQLETSVRVAFSERHPVLKQVSDAVRACKDFSSWFEYVNRGLLLGAGEPYMTHTRFKAVAAQIGKAICEFHKLSEFDDAVEAAWNDHRIDWTTDEKGMQLRKLKEVVTLAFFRNKPVFQPVFHAAYQSGRDGRLDKCVKQGLSLGAKAPHMTEARFKATATRIRKAMSLVKNDDLVLYNEVDFENTVTAIWTARWKMVTNTSASMLQTEWKAATSDPGRVVCRKRIHREWEEMAERVE